MYTAGWSAGPYPVQCWLDYGLMSTIQRVSFTNVLRADHRMTDQFGHMISNFTYATHASHSLERLTLVLHRNKTSTAFDVASVRWEEYVKDSEARLSRADHAALRTTIESFIYVRLPRVMSEKGGPLSQSLLWSIQDAVGFDVIFLASDSAHELSPYTSYSYRETSVDRFEEIRRVEEVGDWIPSGPVKTTLDNNLLMRGEIDPLFWHDTLAGRVVGTLV